MPKFVNFNGSTDSVIHLHNYYQMMTLEQHNDALMCRVFPSSLQGIALEWFHKLSPSCIHNCSQLCIVFIMYSEHGHRQKKDLNSLFNQKKGNRELLREYTRRFQTEMLHIEGCNERIIKISCKRGLPPSSR